MVGWERGRRKVGILTVAINDGSSSTSSSTLDTCGLCRSIFDAAGLGRESGVARRYLCNIRSVIRFRYPMSYCAARLESPWGFAPMKRIKKWLASIRVPRRAAGVYFAQHHIGEPFVFMCSYRDIPGCPTYKVANVFRVQVGVSLVSTNPAKTVIAKRVVVVCAELSIFTKDNISSHRPFRSTFGHTQGGGALHS